MKDIRADFPMLEQPLIYFDTAATALKPAVVIDAMSDFYRHHYGTVHRGVYTLSKVATDLYTEARRSVQHFLGAAHLEEIIFSRGTTAALNMLARAFGEAFIEPGDVILLSEIEHHSNLVPWQMMAKRHGAILRFIPVNDQGELDLNAYATLLDARVKLVSIAHISNVLGTRHQIETIIELAHKQGARVCIDGAQSIAHEPIDVQALDVDFFAFSGHKLYGPTGIGVLYGKRELLEAMPPVEGGGDMVGRVTLEESTYAPLPYKFEAGTPMIAEAIGLHAAINYVTEIGFAQIRAIEEELLAYATEKLAPYVTFLGGAAQQKRGAILTFNIPGVHPLDLVTLLDEHQIAIRTGQHCAEPAMERFGVTSAARISFGIYNTKEEIDRFIESLAAVLTLLKELPLAPQHS